MVGLDGLEPSTSRLSGARSSHLSYRPIFSQVLFSSVHCVNFRSVVPLHSTSLSVMMGFEPSTQTAFEFYDFSEPSSTLFFKSTMRSIVALKNGGDDGIRTHDPLLAGQVLSQLSYTPILGVPEFNFN